MLVRGRMSIVDEIQNSKSSCRQLMDEELTRADIRVIAFGESHRWNNPHRLLVSTLIPGLAEKGFSYLALEIEPQYSDILNAFEAGRVGRMRLEEVLAETGGSLMKGDDACPGYFLILQAARNCGMHLVPVDKNKARRAWILPDYACEPREEVLAAGVSGILDREPESRVIFYGGSNHIYKRSEHLDEPARNHLGMGEIIERKLRNKGQSLLSVGGVLGTEQHVPDLTFERLYQYCGSEQFAVRTRDCPELAALALGEDRRCPWGACFQSDSSECPGITHDICTDIPMSEVKAGAWDILVFHSTSWHEPRQSIQILSENPR